MKTEFKFIRFVEETLQGKTWKWRCVNNANEALGECLWYSRWRKWVFQVDDDHTIFDTTCLADISEFLAILDKERKP